MDHPMFKAPAGAAVGPLLATLSCLEPPEEAGPDVFEYGV